MKNNYTGMKRKKIPIEELNISDFDSLNRYLRHIKKYENQVLSVVVDKYENGKYYLIDKDDPTPFVATMGEMDDIEEILKKNKLYEKLPDAYYQIVNAIKMHQASKKS